MVAPGRSVGAVVLKSVDYDSEGFSSTAVRRMCSSMSAALLFWFLHVFNAPFCHPDLL